MPAVQPHGGVKREQSLRPILKDSKSCVSCSTDHENDAEVDNVICGRVELATAPLPEEADADPEAHREPRNRKHIHFDEGNLQENEAERLRVERMLIDEPKTPYHEPFAESHTGLGSLSASEGSESEYIGRGCFIQTHASQCGSADGRHAPQINGAGMTFLSRSSSTDSSSSHTSGRRLSHEEFEEKRRSLYSNEYRMIRLYRQQSLDSDTDDSASGTEGASSASKASQRRAEPPERARDGKNAI